MAKLLLIDDDADLAHFLQDELASHGHDVHCLGRAEQAPELLASARPPFRLVLLDNNLPGMSGIDFLKLLRDHAVKAPVVLMTGYTTSKTAIEATKFGAYDYVVKPDDFQSLCGQLLPILAQCLADTEPPPQVRLPQAAPRRPAAGPMLVAGPNRAMNEVYTLIGQFAPTDSAVLIRGETGTGKELIAQALHTHSRRAGQPFLAINCAAIPETLLESELFGHEKGAFSSGDKLRKGKLEHANGGTIFLDEIGDMPLPLQSKLLRVLEAKQFERVGGNEAIEVNVRFVSATHRDLDAAIEEGKFRRDLFYRLNRVTIRLPALRERLDDLPILADYFLECAAEEMGREKPKLARESLELLLAHLWPGNVRELQNVLYRALGVCKGSQIVPADLEGLGAAAGPRPAAGPPGAPEDGPAALRRAIEWAFSTNQPELWPLLSERLQTELLKMAFVKLGGNQSEIARRLGINRGTVIKLVKELGLK